MPISDHHDLFDLSQCVRQSIIGDETLAYSMQLLTAELNGRCIEIIPVRVSLVANICTSLLGLSIGLTPA